MNDQVYNISADQLQAFTDRIRAQNVRVKEETAARKEIYDEAGATGFDKKVLRKLVAELERKPDEVAEEAAIMEMYRGAVGRG
jgi:uncharacterized protein (UPF0335 family)